MLFLTDKKGWLLSFVVGFGWQPPLWAQDCDVMEYDNGSRTWMLLLYHNQKLSQLHLVLRLRRSAALPLAVCLYGVERHNGTSLLYAFMVWRGTTVPLAVCLYGVERHNGTSCCMPLWCGEAQRYLLLYAFMVWRGTTVPLAVCLYGVERHNGTSLQQKVAQVVYPVVGFSEHDKVYFCSIKSGQSLD
jgi:hypothetical protein